MIQHLQVGTSVVDAGDRARGRSPALSRLRGGDPAAARPAQEDSVRLCSDDTVHLLPLGPERQRLGRLVHLPQHAVAAGQVALFIGS